MKVITTLTLLVASPAVMAHTGDHSALVSSLAHAFGSAQHMGAALAVMGAVAGVIVLTAKLNTKHAARRVK